MLNSISEKTREQLNGFMVNKRVLVVDADGAGIRFIIEGGDVIKLEPSYHTDRRLTPYITALRNGREIGKIEFPW